MFRTLPLLLILTPLANAQDRPVAFEHVHVVPMDREVVLANQTVVVHDGRIVELGPAVEIEVPLEAVHVNGRDMYLMPGLTDMHVHLTHQSELLLYLACGVTAVRNMWGGPDTLLLRERIRTGETLGPCIFTTGPIMDGEDPTWRGSPVLTDPAAAARAVDEQHDAGYDAIKVYDGLRRDVYEALLARAGQLELPVVGHVPDDAGLRAVLAGGQRSIEHLDGYLEADPSELGELAKLTAEAGAFNCVTLVVHDLPWRCLDIVEQARVAPTFLLLPPSVLARWDPKTDPRYGGITEMTEELWQRLGERMDKLRRIVRSLRAAGAPILLGTDAPNPYVVPGFAIYEELEQLVTAGLSPFEALRTGTVEAARFLGRKDAGTVAVGMAADLRLVKGNPLERVGRTAQLQGVMVGGHWLPKPELDRLVAEMTASYRAPEDWFAGLPALQGESPLGFEVFWNDTQIGADRYGRSSADRHAVIVHEQSVLKDQFQDRKLSALHGPRGGVQELAVSVWASGRRGDVKMSSDGETLVLQGILPSGQEIADRRSAVAGR